MEAGDGKRDGPGARMSDSALDLAHRGGGGGGGGSPRSVLEGGASFYDLGQADEVDVDLLADRFHRVATETDPKDVPTPDRWAPPDPPDAAGGAGRPGPGQLRQAVLPAQVDSPASPADPPDWQVRF